jgi:hypothetical protein
LILMGVIVSFFFYFVSVYFLELIVITKGTVDLGISFIDPIVLKDSTVAIVFLSLVSAIMSIGLELLSKNK